MRTDTEQYHVNLSETKTPSDYVVAPVAGLKGEMQMALLVKKPDHLDSRCGSSGMAEHQS